MKASELIKRLQELVEEYGDLEVHIPDSDTTYRTEEMQDHHLFLIDGNIRIG